jgi:cell division protein FtsZ
MNEMGKAMMGTGEADGDSRALQAAEKAIANPLLDEISLKGARGVLINVTGGYDLTLFELDEAANRIREEVDPDANIIVGSTLDPDMEGRMRVSVVATGIDVSEAQHAMAPSRSFAAAAVAARPAAAAPQPVAEAPAAPAEPEYEMDDAAAETQPAPSLFTGLGMDEVEEDDADDAVPPPAYRPAAAEAPRADPRMRAASASESEYVAPKPATAGRPTPETLARLRAAIQKDTPRGGHHAEAEPQHDVAHRARLGIGSLINRMTGHSDEAAHAERRQPPMSGGQAYRNQPPVAHNSADDGIVDPDQERIEIPAFLRRQAN